MFANAGNLTILNTYVFSVGGDISSSSLIGPYPHCLHHEKLNVSLHDGRFAIRKPKLGPHALASCASIASSPISV